VIVTGGSGPGQVQLSRIAWESSSALALRVRQGFLNGFDGGVVVVSAGRERESVPGVLDVS
jgi:hypothetical protein